MMLAALLLVSQDGQDRSTEALLAAQRESHIRLDKAMKSWMDCADSKAAQLFRSGESAQDVATVAVRSCLQARQDFEDAVHYGFSAIDPAGDESVQVQGQTNDFQNNLINAIAMNIMRSRMHASETTTR